MTGKYQQFYEHWRKCPGASKFLNTFPYKLPLGANLPFRPGNTSGDQILVTKSYDNMFHRLLRLRKKDKGRTRGVVLTGQPGVGMSL